MKISRDGHGGASVDLSSFIQILYATVQFTWAENEKNWFSINFNYFIFLKNG